MHWGGNEAATRLSGINVNRVKVIVYSLSGMLAALAGSIEVARLSSAQPTAGTGYELDAIAAVVLGGTSLAGGKGRIVGIHQSDDVLRLLPPELAALSVSELELEFYRRLVEKRLLTYKLQGDAWHEKITQRPVSHQQHEEQPRGPFIVCVDTSGSMGGFNERCAKAFCLALLKVALADRRRCYIMLFAHDVIGYELTGDDGLEQAIRFLSQRFRGGTDLAACLSAVVKRMEGPLWQDADAVIVSDFIAQRLPEEVVRSVKHRQQQQQQRFHAVAMSTHGKPGIMRIFDHIWRFDTGLKSRILRHWRR